jgi:hypothetical protein
MPLAVPLLSDPDSPRERTRKEPALAFTVRPIFSEFYRGGLDSTTQRQDCRLQPVDVICALGGSPVQGEPELAPHELSAAILA